MITFYDRQVHVTRSCNEPMVVTLCEGNYCSFSFNKSMPYRQRPLNLEALLVSHAADNSSRQKLGAALAPMFLSSSNNCKDYYYGLIERDTRSLNQ